ncbi:tyrosine-type recombinase/integrase [Rubrivivax gelatinosus]|uniref:Integrase n=1 Tax=Rubrivivax gelatinosus TaxID=28068 RepID=A0A4R2MU50_RUBGE|nr:site-specific integrase [Rubrivivax gelatinosus]MBK1688900.1 integrase [Rubrivivax gelatinosus]TCP03063.1 integrase [Rubrivivax gelatinosus]
MPKIAKELNALAVSRLKAPGVHPVGVVPGLALQVSETGGRSWVLRVMVGTRRRWMGLGGYPEVSLADARDKARAARELVRQGVDPIEKAREQRSALKSSAARTKTFRAVAEAYVDAHRSAWRNAKHAAQWAATLETYAHPVVGDLLVADIEREHVLEILRPIWTEKTETATRVRGRVESVLSYAMAAGYRPEGLNPARWRGHLDKLLPKPSKVAKVEHHPALPIPRVGEFMQRLRAMQGMGARALEFAILTAARSGEVRGATWNEIDIEAAVWTVPASRMKAGKEHRVPLSTAAVDLLKAVPRLVNDDNLVFVSPRGKALSDMTLSAVTRRMAESAVPHGFRSTFRDWAAERTTYPSDLAETALAHAIGNKVEAAYRRGDQFEKRRRMMADWAAFLAHVERSPEVVDLAERRAAG